MDFLIHWPPGPVVATVQCQGLESERERERGRKSRDRKEGGEKEGAGSKGRRQTGRDSVIVHATFTPE